MQMRRVCTAALRHPKLQLSMSELVIHRTERQSLNTSTDVHPGWLRATAILLRGMERLRSREGDNAGRKDDERRR